MSVYCKQCRHFRTDGRIPLPYGPPENNFEEQSCEAPENKMDNHLNPDEANKIARPWCINRFNDCVWFDPIEEGTSSSSSSSSSSSGVV